jgi:hypothetical protein
MLGDGFSIFDLAQEDKAHPWEPTLELLLTAEGDKGEAIIIFGRIGLGTMVRTKSDGYSTVRPQFVIRGVLFHPTRLKG